MEWCPGWWARRPDAHDLEGKEMCSQLKGPGGQEMRVSMVLGGRKPVAAQRYTPLAPSFSGRISLLFLR